MPDVTISVFGDASHLIAEDKAARLSLKEMAQEATATGKTIAGVFSAFNNRVGSVQASYRALATAATNANARIQAAEAKTVEVFAQAATKQVEAQQRLDRLKAGFRSTQEAEERMHRERLAAIDREFDARRQASSDRADAQAEAAERAAHLKSLAAKTQSKTAMLRVIAEGEQEAKAILAVAGQERIRLQSEQATAVLRSEEALQTKLAQLRRAAVVTRPGLGNGSALREAGGTMLNAAAVTAAPLAAAAYGASAYTDATLNALNNTDLSQKERTEGKAAVGQLIDRGTDRPLNEVFDAFKQASDFRKEGQSVADTMRIVDIAVKAASADNADAGQTAASLARAMFQFNAPAADAARIMNLLEVVAAKNNLTLQQLTENSGRAAATAAELGTPLNQLISIYGVLTKEGLNAGQAATSVRSIFKSLTTETPQQDKVIKELSKTYPGLSAAFGYANVHARGLGGSLDYLGKTVGYNKEVLLKLLPDQRSNIAAMSLMTDRAKDLHDTLAEGDKAWAENSRIQGQFAERSQTASFQLKALINQLLKASDGLGVELLPKVIALVNLLTQAVKWFDSLSPSVKNAVVNLMLGATAVNLLAGGMLKLIGNAVGVIAGVKQIAGWLGNLTIAARAAAAAEGAVATEGLSAFAVGGPLAVAIAAFAGYCVYWWGQIKTAQDQATASVQGYQNKLAGMKGQGERQADTATLDQVNNESGDIDSALRAARAKYPDNRYWQDREYRAQMQSTNEHNGSHYDLSNPNYSSAIAGQNRYNALLDSKAQLTDRLRELNTAQAPASRSVIATGADGFALAVSRIDPRSIVTKSVESCAEFVSRLYQKAGLKLPSDRPILGAKALRDYVLGAGGQPHGGPALPGDLVVYHGGRMGTKAGGGYHVGVAVGDGTDWESTKGRTKREGIAGNLHWSGPGTTVEYITVPGSTFTNAGASAAPYLNPAGGPTGPHTGGAGRGRGTGGAALGSPLGMLTADGSLAPERVAAVARLTAYEKALAAIDAQEQKMLATADKTGQSQKALAVRIAETTEKIALDKKTSEDAAAQRPALISAQEKAYQSYRAAIDATNHAAKDFNALQATVNNEKTKGEKPTAQQTQALHGLRVAYASLEKGVGGYHREAVAAAQDVKRLDNTLKDSERNILAHRNALDRLKGDLAAANERAALSGIADLTVAGKGGAIGHDSLMAQMDAKKVGAAGLAGLGSLSGESAASLLSILGQMKDKTDDQVRAATVLRDLVTQIDAETRRFNAEGMRALTTQYRAIVGDPTLKAQTKIDTLQADPDFAKVSGYADEIKRLQKGVTVSAANEALEQNRIDREELLRRVNSYGMDRDAFLSALMDKTRALAQSVTLDANMADAGQQEMLDAVRRRLTEETSGQTDLTADEIAMDQRRAAAMQDNLNAMTIQRNKWVRDDARASKEVEAAWRDGMRRVADTFSGDLAGMLTGSKKHMTSLKDLFKSTFDEILQTVIRHFVQQALLHLADLWTGKGKGKKDSWDTALAVGGGAGGGGGPGAGGGLGGILGAVASVGALGTLSPRAAPAVGSNGPLLGDMAGLGGYGAAGSRALQSSALQSGGGPMVPMAPGASALGTVGMAASGLKDAAGVAGGFTRLLGSGLGGAVGKAMPVIGAGLALAGLLGGLFGQSKPDYVNKVGSSRDGTLSGADYTSAIDSGYSGATGMRQILQQHSDLLGRMNSSATGGNALTIHPGGITVIGDADPEKTASAVMARIQDQFTLQSAATGTGGY